MDRFLSRAFGNPPEDHLPHGWAIDFLDNRSKRGTGHTPDKEYPEYWNGGVKWVSLADSNKLDKVYISETDKSISESGIQKSSAVKHPTGTVIVSRDAGVGKSAILADEMAVSQHFIAWVCGPDLHNLFLYYWLQFMKKEFERIAVGSTIKTIGMGYFTHLKIPFPSLSEQREIAHILGTWDAAIGTLEQLITALQKRKRGLMQRVLTGQVRFLEWNTSHVGVSSNWQRVKLGDIFERVQRKVEADTETVLSITATIGFVDQREKFGRVIAGKNLENYIDLHKGEFAYNKGNSDAYPQGCIYRLVEFEKGAAPNVYYCFRPKSDDICGEFYKYYFEAGLLNGQLRRLINSGVRNDGLLNIAADKFFSVDVMVPPKKEQEYIAKFFASVDEEIALFRCKLKLLQQQKQGLMQRLLTGQVRVRVDEDEGHSDRDEE